MLRQGNVSLELFQKDVVNDGLPEREPRAGGYDAVYFDPFSPEANPDMWTVGLLAKIRAMMNPDGKLTTYCVKSVVQRYMRQAGFRIEKTRGPTDGKREVLIAHRL